MAKIYISSTFEDLKDERKKAAQAVRRLEHQAVCMEDYVSESRQPLEKCIHDVRQCEAYIGIFAWRYGFIPEGYHKSITHLEYEAARDAGIPCLIFILDPKARWSVEFVDTDEDLKKIKALRAELQKKYIVSFFSDPDELSARITASLKGIDLRTHGLPPTEGIGIGSRIVENVNPPKLIRQSNINNYLSGGLYKTKEIGIGSRLGKYEVLEKLGKGGKGIVFKVKDTLEENFKAIKMVPSAIGDSPVDFKKLKHEVNVASGISHPNVVKVLGLEEKEGKYFIVMEYIYGHNLEQVLADSTDYKMGEIRVVEVMKKLALGLKEVHQCRVIHRDIKPSNIMVTGDGRVKILDFGISYQVTQSMTELVGEEKRTGTLPFMAPEQLSTNFGKEDAQADIWGFGATMYRLLSGDYPFKTREQIIDIKEKPHPLEGVSPGVKQIVMKCLEKDRGKRFHSMDQVLAALEAVGREKKKEPSSLRSWIPHPVIIILAVAIGLYLGIKTLNRNPSKPETTKEKIQSESVAPETKKLNDDITALKARGYTVSVNEQGFTEVDIGDGIVLVYIPAGEFTMGSNEGDVDEKPHHTVSLDGYCMGKTEVTNKQFQAFIDATHYKTTAEKKNNSDTWQNPGFSQGDNHPVVKVSWNDAVNYCKWLSISKGLRFTLPTEAQWEKGARGTDGRKYPWGEHEPYYNGKWYANYAAYNDWDKREEDGYEYTSPVGSFPWGASPYGLLDMAGNVWEWCSDWYSSDYYRSNPASNPLGPSTGTYRIFRGGSWNVNEKNIRCSFRDYNNSNIWLSNVGFRVVCTR